MNPAAPLELSVGKAPHRLSGGATPEPAQGGLTPPPEAEFEEPAAAEDREDLGTDVAPRRLDVPIEPHAPTRTPLPEGCSLPDEGKPEASDFDGTG